MRVCVCECVRVCVCVCACVCVYVCVIASGAIQSFQFKELRDTEGKKFI